jgi:dihydroorotase
VVFDPQAPWRVDARTLRSQGRNSAFFGRELTGRVRATVVAGNIVHDA